MALEPLERRRKSCLDLDIEILDRELLRGLARA